MLINLLRDGAQKAPDQVIIASRDGSLTYAQCLARSESLARGLRERAIDRFAFVIGDPGDQFQLFCASSAVGSEACAYPPGLDEAGIDELAAQFDHEVVVADRPLTLGRARVVSLEDLPVDGGALPAETCPAPTLLLTTGTTGRPRAARHDWGALVSTLKRTDERPGVRWLLGYNLNQYAGILMMMHVLASRATLVVPASNQPRDALEAMRDLEVNRVAATPTFWWFLVALLEESTAKDIHLQQITLGGEASPPALLAALARLFPDARIFQVYGATEFGLAASVGDRRNGLPTSVLDRGDDARVQMRIVDGELQVRSKVGMLGYYGEDEVGEEWRRTGDLVEVRDDRIFFVGRASETINVGGVKVHPLPVEEVTSAVDGVELARAYGRPNSVTGQIVALDVVARSGADTEQLEKEIRVACESLPTAAQPRRIRFVPSIEVRGNKIARGLPAQ